MQVLLRLNDKCDHGEVQLEPYSPVETITYESLGQEALSFAGAVYGC